jgi:hypothetical protein
MKVRLLSGQPVRPRRRTHRVRSARSRADKAAWKRLFTSRPRLSGLRRGAGAWRAASPSRALPFWVALLCRVSRPAVLARPLVSRLAPCRPGSPSCVASRALPSWLALLCRVSRPAVLGRPLVSRLALFCRVSAFFVASLLPPSRLSLFRRVLARCRAASPAASRLQGARRGCPGGRAPRPWLRSCGASIWVSRGADRVGRLGRRALLLVLLPHLWLVWTRLPVRLPAGG